MSDDTNPRQRRVEVGLKVNLKYPDRSSFVERFSVNISRAGLFIRAKDPLPVGARVRFEYRLSDQTRILRGLGVVRWSRPASEATAVDPPGMGVEFVDLDSQSEELINEIVLAHGDGERAPQRSTHRATTTRAADSDAPVPRGTSKAPELDEEEQNLLDALTPNAGALGRPDPTPPAEGIEAQGELEAPSDNTPVSHAVEALLLDLAGTKFACAARDADGDRFDEHVVDLRFDESGLPGESGAFYLPGLLSWMEPEAPSRLAQIIGRRAGWESSTQRAIDGCALDFNGYLDIAIEALLAPTLEGASLVNRTVAVVPAHRIATFAPILRRKLEALGFRPEIVSDAAALAQSLQLVPAAGETLLTVQVNAHDCRIALLSEGGAVVAAAVDYHACLYEADDAVTKLAAWELLREYEMAADDDPSLRSSLLAQVTALRRDHAGDGSWEVTLAGAPVSLDIQTVAACCAPVSEKLATRVHSFLAELGIAPESLSDTILAAEEMPWPGLVEIFERVTGLSPILLDASPWIRINGA